ncbi:MAG TPA: M43 family zinc metalloprotease [Chryseosolibacter sp.]|nr:M43 family zinc metalloprotease [Chryseosolibacter sp.]
MKHFYRFILLTIACSVSHLSLAQQQSAHRGKSIIRHNNDVRQRPTQFSPFLSDSIQANKLKLNSGKPNVHIGEAPVATERNCFTVQHEQNLAEKFPTRLGTAAFENKLAMKREMSRMNTEGEIVYQIPTVVHIVHHGEPLGTGSNISQEQILSQFEVLNEDFRRIGAGYNDHPSGADINIEFVPVLVDPQGKVLQEPGINRVFGYSAYYDYDIIELELKPNTQWDPDRYFNIWVLKFGGGFSGYLGYAQFPSFSGLEGLPEDGAAHTDGVVIGYQYFGRVGDLAENFDMGRTTTHEVGHWLGLRHIWGDGDCSVDDFCADTPNASGPNTSCEFRDSCPDEGVDMIENYMDYSTDACMNIFTSDQKSRIRTVMEVSPRRTSLVACQIAPDAVVGANASDWNNRSWFTYTASADEVVSISSLGSTELDTRVSIYSDCNALPIMSNDNASGTLQSALSVSLQAGQTIKILWENDMYEAFEWQLAVAEPQTGAACGVAALAATGTNSLAATDFTTFWYKYESAANEKITINSPGHDFTVYGNTCAQLTTLKSSNTSTTIYDLSEGELIYIAFDASGGNFDWTLTSEAVRAGESCDDAGVANSGENTIPYDAPFSYWYTFTMTDAGKININTSTEHTGEIILSIFKQCDGQPVAKTNGNSIILNDIPLAAGETVLVHWESDADVGNLRWTLESLPYNNGELCDIAKEAQLGTNHTDAAPQWFKYTTTKFTNLKISSIGTTEVDTHVMIKRECDGPITADNDNALSGGNVYAQGELILYGLEAGETFYILWSEKWSYDGFDWFIEEVEPLAGDNCITAKQAVVGTNVVEYRPEHNYFANLFWTKFIIPASGKTVSAFASQPIDAAIYVSNDCQTFSFIDSDQGLSRAVNLPAGTEIVIIWDIDDITEEFTWELKVQNTAAGDDCYNPIRATEGTNTASNTPMWYDYVMTEAGSLHVKFEPSEESPRSFVGLLQGCGDAATILFQEEDEAFVSGLNAGDRIMIYWTVGYPFGSATWTLDEIPQRQGDTCDDPLPASYGLNHATYATQWFTYTAEATGNLIISSRAFTFNNTYLEVFDGCNGETLASSDDIFSFEDFIQYFQSEALVENVQAGQTLLIKWSGIYSFQPFDWEIVSDAARQGDSCEDPITAVEGINNAMKPVPSWFTFTMPRTGPLTINSIGHSELNTNLEVYSTCDGEIIASSDDYFGDSQSFVHFEELQEGETVLIRWSNFYVSEKYTFDWKLTVGEPDPGLVCSFPAEALIGENSVPNYISNFFWYTFTMPEDNKKLNIKRLTVPSTYARTLGITADCDRFNDYAIGDDSISVTGLSAGQEVRIFFGELKAGERNSFDWELTVTDLEEGDLCATPREASHGTHHSSGAPAWYTYTMPFDGSAYLSSMEGNDRYIDTYVEVWDACEGTLLASNDNTDDWTKLLSDLMVDNLTEGQILYIKWALNGPFQIPFNWKLNVINPNNHAPVVGDVVFDLGLEPQNGQIIGTVSAEDADGDALSYALINGNDDGAFSIDPTTGEVTVADAAALDGIAAGREMQVSVSDYMVSTQANISIAIVTSALDDEGNGIYLYPNPASDKVLLHTPTGLEVRHIQMIDLSGRVMTPLASSNRQLDVSNLRHGIYILTLDTNRGRVMVKLAVVK